MPISTDMQTTHGDDVSSRGPQRTRPLAGVAHDLRSPLNAILGWARILAVKHGGDPELAMIAERIERSCRAQLKTIGELEELARDEDR